MSEKKITTTGLCININGRGKRLYLISPRPLDLGAELFHGLVQPAVAAQLGLHRRQVGSPLPAIHPPLVLIHPAQQILNVAHGDFIQLGSHPHGGLLKDLGSVDLSHGDLCGGHTGLKAQVVLAADVHQPLMKTIHSGDGNQKRDFLKIIL